MAESLKVDKNEDEEEHLEMGECLFTFSGGPLEFPRNSRCV